MTRSAAEVEAEVEASRLALDRDVEALKQKMTPGQLLDQATQMMGGTGQQVASRFVEQAKANPMPLAVMGLGLAWLMMSNNRQPQGVAYGGVPYGYGEPRSFTDPTVLGAYDEAGSEPSGGAKEGIKDKVQSIGHGASSALGGAGHALSGGASQARRAGHRLGEGLGSAAGAARQRAAQAGQRAQRTFSDTLQTEPLLIAGLGLLVGAAIGAALPSTAAEDRMVGPARDRLMSKSKGLAQTGVQQAASAAQAAYGGAKAELDQGGELPLVDRVEAAARSGVQGAREQIQGQQQPH